MKNPKAERLGLIYGICHKATNRWYIGQTVLGFEHRWKEHQDCAKKSNLHLYAAMRKYGLEAFTHEILEDSIPEDKLDEREQYYIQKYDSYNSGFNNTLGGQGIHGYRHTAEGKRKISKALRESSWRWNTPERAKKISDAQKGRKFTDEHREHIKEAANRNKRYGNDNPFGGKIHSDYSRKKMSESSTRNRVQRIAKNTGLVIETYENQWDAAFWVKNYTRTEGRVDSIYHRLSEAIHHLNGTKSAYGFLWKAIRKEEL